MQEKDILASLPVDIVLNVVNQNASLRVTLSIKHFKNKTYTFVVLLAY